VSARPPLTIERLNELIQAFGEHEKAALRAEKRGAMRSPLFDMLRRSLLGWQFKYDYDPVFLREVAAVMPPEEVGRRMKVPGSRPYYLQLFLLLQDTLGARQQRMLESGLREGDPFPEERLDDLLFLTDFWERASRSYRNDGLLVPDEAGGTQPILDEASLDGVRDMLGPVDAETLAAARRLAATLEAWCFVAHGEQRDGIFGHGPYHDERGRVLLFREFNDLRTTFLPWVEGTTPNLHGNLVFAYECRDVTVRCDMFGGLVTEPLEFADRVERFAVGTQEGGVMRPLPRETWDAVRDAAAASTNEIYFRVVDWEPAFRYEYGAHLFANHLKGFLDLAGIDADDRLREAARETIARRGPAVGAGPEVPAAMVHWGTTEGAFIWPVVA
jgi:hypothetical protein